MCGSNRKGVRIFRTYPSLINSDQAIHTTSEVKVLSFERTRFGTPPYRGPASTESSLRLTRSRAANTSLLSCGRAEKHDLRIKKLTVSLSGALYPLPRCLGDCLTGLQLRLFGSPHIVLSAMRNMPRQQIDDSIVPRIIEFLTPMTMCLDFYLPISTTGWDFLNASYWEVAGPMREALYEISNYT